MESVKHKLFECFDVVGKWGLRPKANTNYRDRISFEIFNFDISLLTMEMAMGVLRILAMPLGIFTLINVITVIFSNIFYAH